MPSNGAMFAFASVVASEEKFARCAAPGLQRVSEPDAVVAQYTDATSMTSAYNEILDAFAARDDLEALVLLHEDTEILDSEFCAKVRRRLAADPEIAVIGVVGARGVRSLSWWEGEGAGRVAETRGLVDFGGGTDEVDTVDGLLLVLSPWAVRNLRFDDERFRGFHAYDADFCFSARAAGRKVVVDEIAVFHHTKGGYGDEQEFRRSDEVWRAKWREAGERRAEPCTVCRAEVSAEVAAGERLIVACPACGTGITIPAPDRDIESDGIWVEQYGGGRMANREHWYAEARVRADWVARHASGGLLVDIGGGTGEMAAVAAERGFRSALIEPSGWAAGQARELGVERVLGDVADWPRVAPGEHADAVTLFHVLEHVHEPLAFLAAVRAILRPGAPLFVEVPNFAAEDAQRDPVAWTGTALNDHVAHYTPGSLARLMADAGFAVAEVTPLPSMVYDHPAYWASKCERWRALGMVRPSEDLLRLRATA